MANPRPTPKPGNLGPPWPPGTSGNPAGRLHGVRRLRGVRPGFRVGLYGNIGRRPAATPNNSRMNEKQGQLHFIITARSPRMNEKQGQLHFIITARSPCRKSKAQPRTNPPQEALPLGWSDATGGSVLHVEPAALEPDQAVLRWRFRLVRAKPATGPLPGESSGFFPSSRARPGSGRGSSAADRCAPG